MLHRLGIKPTKDGAWKDDKAQQIAAMTLDSSEPFDVMAAKIIDPLFKDEVAARKTLGTNFTRLAHSIERVSKVEVLKSGKARRVADLGGGPGIIASWLVLNGLCETCDVYDHAKNALMIGETWATSLGATGVRFHHETFADVGKRDHERFDFVFAEHALSFDYMQPRISPRGQYMNPKDCPFLPCYVEMAEAFKKLLHPHGTGLIGAGNCSPVCASALCLALREQDLAINWKLTSNNNGLQVFLNPDEKMLFETHEEDALAILSDMEDRKEFSKYDVLSLERIFQTGRKFIDLSSEENDTEFRCTVFQYAGLAGLFQSTSSGSKTAKFYGAGRIPSLAESAMTDANRRRVIERYVDPRLESILAVV